MSETPQPSEAALERSIGAFTGNGWRIEDKDGHDFTLFSPQGFAYPVLGIHLAPLDDDALDAELLSDEQLREEADAGTLCELLIRYRFRTGRLLTTHA